MVGGGSLGGVRLNHVLGEGRSLFCPLPLKTIHPYSSFPPFSHSERGVDER